MSRSGIESQRHSSAHMRVFALNDTSLWDFGIQVELLSLQVEEPVRKWTAEPVKKKSSTYPVNFDLKSVTIVDKVVTIYVYYFVIG